MLKVHGAQRAGRCSLRRGNHRRMGTADRQRLWRDMNRNKEEQQSSRYVFAPSAETARQAAQPHGRMDAGASLYGAGRLKGPRLAPHRVVSRVLKYHILVLTSLTPSTSETCRGGFRKTSSSAGHRLSTPIALIPSFTSRLPSYPTAR